MYRFFFFFGLLHLNFFVVPNTAINDSAVIQSHHMCSDHGVSTIYVHIMLCMVHGIYPCVLSMTDMG